MILDNLRVLEIASGLSGPLAGLRLGDLGATVIKLEWAPGDWMREAAPQAPGLEDSAAFVSLNRGKRFIGLGQRTEASMGLVRRAVAWADVVIADWTEAALNGAGLVEARSASMQPDSGTIWVDISPYGRVGPLTDRPGSDLTLQAASGYTRWLGNYGEPPNRLGADVAGATAGILAAHAVLASLYWKRSMGAGQRVEISQLASLLSMKQIHLAAQTNPEKFSGPRVGGPNYPPERGWKAADNPLTFSFGGSVGQVGRQGWAEFVEEIGLGWMRTDPRFKDDPTGRRTTGLGPEAQELRAEYEREFARHPAAELVDLVRRNGGMAAAFTSHKDLLNEAQVEDLGLVREAEVGDEKKVSVTAFPARFSTTTVRVSQGSVEFGADSLDVAMQLGLDESAASTLLRDGVLVSAGRREG